MKKYLHTVLSLTAFLALFASIVAALLVPFVLACLVSPWTLLASIPAGILLIAAADMLFQRVA